MKKQFYIFLLALLASVGIGVVQAAYRVAEGLPALPREAELATQSEAAPTPVATSVPVAPPDTLPVVKPTVMTTLADTVRGPVDLKDPDNLRTQADYDTKTGQILFGTKLGDEYLGAPFALTWDEYSQLMARRSMAAWYRAKNAEAFREGGKDKFDFTDMHFDLGPLNKVFGPGGVRVKTQGSAELKIGANTRFTDNPSLSERNRRVFGFDFDEKINLSLNGKVGNKVNMDFNYNSEATFDFDSQALKLRYEGQEDEIIKLIEAGNVSMPTQSGLIRGASSLFGVRADLQFGKLKVQTVISQKKSASSSVSSQGGSQVTSFEFSADSYDENRHFFLSHFFRDHYDEYMRQLPTVASGITIKRVEIWVTNNTGATTDTRNIVALTDLGESAAHISNSLWSGTGSELPANSANTLYSELNGSLAAARDISQATLTLDGAGLAGGTDYEKLESARKLSSSEYTVNTALGYVSLRQSLQTDQVLAVAFEYTYRGQTYQVGEFAADRKDNKEVLFVKALKNTACTPRMGNWHLMMRNVYSLGASSVQRDRFKLDVKILSDTTGVYLSYLPEPGLKDKKLIALMGLDRLDNNNKVGANGAFDFVEGYTIDASNGRVYFPMVEPFGKGLARAIGNDAVAQRYVFQELYDSTRTVAKQIAEKNKYRITGQYKATRNDEIQLGAMNVPRGSVVVTAGGQTLMEGSDYTVDYNAGVVRILNKSILDAGTSINVSLESNTDFGMQRKTMFGIAMQYDFSKDFQLGGTFMHLGEKPLTTKVAMGSEPLNNTLWGLNMSWKKQSQRLTDWLDRLPLLHCTAPSSINFTAEFAQLVAGKSRGVQGNASYIDDFENAKSEIDISNPKEWTLSSVPSMFPESKYSGDVRYGYNRALLAWYYIDPLFTRRSSSLTPGHLKNDLKQLSDPDVREVYKSELFPNKSINMQESNTLNVLNLAFYPNERGPYNLDPSLDVNGHLTNPASRWGGMMRKLETSDFETANIEYIEFWLLDPFIKAREAGTTFSGQLYFNLGEISEDILKDGKKFYESGLPVDDDPTQYTETVWGRVPTQSTVTYAFNTQSGSRSKQDVGFNGLTSEQERTYPAYANFLAAIQSKVSTAVYDSIAQAPSADVYHYFRGSDYDREQRGILDRYKYINNPNGNSVDSDHSPESYSTAYKATPDVEDINQDFTLNEYEKYYQYRVNISPEAMQVGQNYIVDKRVTSEKTRDGVTREYTWYQFRIPVDQYEQRVGGISDFSSIRFMRMFMTGFEKPAVLRMATLNLVHGEWRAYVQALYQGKAPETSGTLEVSAVNFEENNEKDPVNYILPPGISRVVDPGQTQVLQNNEQALALTVKGLASGDARAVYKNTTLDLRRYKHLQMFTHANSLNGQTAVADGQVSVFIRLGSDYRSNFYEYEIPLEITPPGRYADNNTSARIIWPEANMLDIDLTLLTNAKRNRNKQKALGQLSYSQLYSEYDPDRPANRISVMGNPSLGEVRTIMIGIRNNSRQVQYVEVWANELRLQQFTNKGGWAAQSQLNLQLSDIATLNLTGHVETEGFGGLEESVSQRRDDNLLEYSVTSNVQAGKFLPEKAKLNAPIYYSYSKQRTSPRYNPLDTDMELSEALDALANDAQRDSLRNIAEHVVTNKNFSISGARFNISTKNHPMPYDPANFTFGYAYSSRNTTGETTAWEKNQNWKYSFGYGWSPNFQPFEPFKKSKNRSKWFKLLKEQSFSYAPQNLSFNSDITRSYYELQERDMENLDNTSLPLTWSSDFLWNRSFQLRWDLTKNLHANFSSGTNAEIEQPYTAVNKDLYPDRYTAWKDSVWHSIKELGRPLSYQQNFDVSWRLPLNKLPLFDWLTVETSYNATYNWQRGTELEDGSSFGNTINNSRNVTGNGRINMETLYNHVPFLKAVNRKYAQTPKGKSTTPAKPKNYEKEIVLRADTTQVLQHNQRSKKLRVTALRPDGSRYPLRYRVVDNNRILVLSQDTVRVKVTVAARKRTEDEGWYKALQMGTRFLMMVRNISVNYTNKYNMSVPGFMPEIGDILGQTKGFGSGFAPGVDFAFGLTGESYLQRAAQRGWLLMTDSVTTPATTNLTESMQIRATLEPFRDVKIDLNASRNVTRNRSIQYMFDGMPVTETGSFSITTISLGTAFERTGSPDKGYPSKTFGKFCDLLQTYRNRVEARYAGAIYPEGTTFAGQTFDPANGAVSAYAPDVMIPAFLEAYTAGGGGLDIFPSLWKMLPNWSITYGGLAKLPKMKKVFKSFNLNHAYKSVYSVGSYNTFTSFMSYMGGMGFINDVATGNPVPSGMYDVSAVSLNESFSPLVGIDMTFMNNLTAKVEMRRTRVLMLSLTSQQLTETRSNDFVIGLGYKIADLKLFAPKRTVKTRSKGTGANRQTTTNAAGFANDLNLRLDFTWRNQSALNRDILTQLTQATSGNKAVQVSFSADYALSKFLTLTAYYDRQMNKPLLTSSSFPVTTQDFGISLKFILNR